MRSLAVLLVVATAGIAQSPLATLTGGTNQGNVGNNIFFDLQVNTTVTITQIDFLCGANTVASAGGVLDVYLGPTSYVGNTLNQALWTLVATTGPITVTPSAVSAGILTNPFALGPGNYAVALKSNNFNHGYTNGAGGASCGATPGSCTNSLFSNAQLTLRAGANQNTPWSSALNQPRIFNGAIYYTLGGTPIAVASWQPNGSGCYGFYHSFREFYGNPSTSFDLKATSGTNALRLNFVGSGYAVQPFVNGTANWHTPTGTATNLALANDATAIITTPFPVPYPMPGGPVVTNQFEICSNGFISPAATNGTASQPSVAGFLTGAPRWAGCWFNFDPSVGGQVNWEVDPSGQQFYVTWVAVNDFGTTGTNTWQFMFDSNGNVEYRYGTMSLQQGGTYPCLVGYTPGGGALDPNDTDLSALASVLTTGPIDNPPLTLALSSRPLLGTSPGFQTTNMEATQAIGGLLINFVSAPGIDLGFLGAPNCRQYVSLTGAITNLFITPPGGPGNVNFPIPNATSFNGVTIFGQSACLGSAFNGAFGTGLNTSNGVRMVVGSL